MASFGIAVIFLAGVLVGTSQAGDVGLPSPFRGGRELGSCCVPKDCSDIRNSSPSATSGVYTIQPIPGYPIKAYCKMDFEGGGWTMIQRRGARLLRGESRISFQRNWEEYERGFGKASGDHWLGLVHISALTRLEDPELYIILEDGEAQKLARYKVFHVEDSSDDYRLKIKDYSGSAGDSMAVHNNVPFSTSDYGAGKGYAESYKGGWWYSNSHQAHLNGVYGDNTYGVGINWWQWHKDYEHSLSLSVMMIRSKAYGNRDYSGDCTIINHLVFSFS